MRGGEGDEGVGERAEPMCLGASGVAGREGVDAIGITNVRGVEGSWYYNQPYREARVEVLALLGGRATPRCAACEAARVSDGGMARCAPRVVAVDIIDAVAHDGGAIRVEPVDGNGVRRELPDEALFADLVWVGVLSVGERVWANARSECAKRTREANARSECAKRMREANARSECAKRMRGRVRDSSGVRMREARVWKRVRGAQSLHVTYVGLAPTRHVVARRAADEAALAVPERALAIVASAAADVGTGAERMPVGGRDVRKGVDRIAGARVHHRPVATGGVGEQGEECGAEKELHPLPLSIVVHVGGPFSSLSAGSSSPLR